MKPFLLKSMVVCAALLLVPLLAAPAFAQQSWGTQLNADFVTHPWHASHCDSAAVDSALGKWSFVAYPRSGRVLALTFRVRNTGIMDNLTRVKLKSELTQGAAVDSIFFYKDNGDGLFNVGDTPIDSMQLDTLVGDTLDSGWSRHLFPKDDSVTFSGFFAELPPNDTTYFHVLVHIDSTVVLDDPATYDTAGIGLRIDVAGLQTEFDTDSSKTQVRNPCTVPYLAGGSGAPPKAAAYNVMLRIPTWSDELNAWYVTDWKLKDSDSTDYYCTALGVERAWNKWHFNAFARDDAVPILTFAIRNNGPLDTMTEVTITSELQQASSIARLFLYADATGDSVFNASDDILAIQGTPGAFGAGGTALFDNFLYQLPAHSVKYFHVVAEMNTAAIEVAPATYDGKGVGVRIASGGITLKLPPSPGASPLVQNQCYPGGAGGSAYNAIIQIPSWGDEVKAHYVTDTKIADSSYCTGNEARGLVLANAKWHFNARPIDSATVLTFAIRNKGPEDTLTSLTVTSQNEKPFSVRQLRLYRDNGDSVFGTGDTPLQTVTVGADSASQFAKDSTARFGGLTVVIPGFDTTFFHVVAWMKTDSIMVDSVAGKLDKSIYASFDSAGIGVKLVEDSIQLAVASGKSTEVKNICTGTPASLHPLAYNVVLQTLNWGEDMFSKWFEPISVSEQQYVAKRDDAGHYPSKVRALTFAIQHRTKFGDDTLKTLRLTSRAEEPYSIQRIYLYRDDGNRVFSSTADALVDSFSISAPFEDGDTVSFPRQFSDFMHMDTAVAHYQDTVTYYHVVVDLNEAALNADPLQYMCKGLKIDIGAGGIGMRFAYDTSGTVSNPRIPPAIQLNTMPLHIAASDLIFDLWYDADGNGGANIGDSIRIRANLSANSIPAGQVDYVWTNLSQWYPSLSTVVLYDQAADYHFEARVLLDSTGGILDTFPATKALEIWVHAKDNDHACSEDSAKVRFKTTVNWVDLMAPTHWGARKFTRWNDVDNNGCLGIGDSVKIEAVYGDSLKKMDLDSVFANLLEAGLGGPVGTSFDRYPLVRVSRDTFYETTAVHTGPPVTYDIVVTDSVWYSLLWKLQANPQDHAVDSAAGKLWVTVFGKDNGGNFDTTQTSTIAQSVDTKLPLAITGLTATSLPNGMVRLCWTTEDADAMKFFIYHDSAGVRHGFPDSAYSFYDSNVVNGSKVADGSHCWQSDVTTGLQDGKIYRFIVRTMDDCGNVEYNANVVAARVDATPAQACVFQPDTGSIYSQAKPLTVYVRPAIDSLHGDLFKVQARGRLANRGDGLPGPWIDISAAITQHLTGEDVRFAIPLDTAALRSLVGTQTAVIQLVVKTWDEVGNINTDAQALAACSPVFWFRWTNVGLVGEIARVNDELPLYQPYCDTVGFKVSGSSNAVLLQVSGGNEPYRVVARLDANVVLDSLANATSVEFNLDATGLRKGKHTLAVNWTDVGGATTSAQAMLCMADTIAPCAQITYPVDGKCIHRSWSTLDPVDVCLTVNPRNNCLDTAGVLKIDFQWAEQCCEGFADILYDTITIADTLGGTGSDTALCTDYFTDGRKDSTVCVDSTANKFTITYRDSVVVDTIPCTGLWKTFKIVSGGAGSEHCAAWVNTADLSWVTQSGTNIYLRAQVYDDQGNVFITPCVRVCVDIETPPMCISSPDLCISGGVAKLPGSNSAITILASLESSGTGITYDDINQVYLTWKKSSDPDLYSDWATPVQMVPATNSTFWRYDSLNATTLTGGVNYDFRVIVHTIWDTWSYDYNGDHQFDAGTFDTANCDAVTWFVDNMAANIHIDTLRTMVNGEMIVQPNVGCTMSDPRGWAWAQYGQDITVQPLAEPLGDASDIVKVQWTLYDGQTVDHAATCACQGGFTPDGASSKVIAIKEGADALSAITFNPTIAPFVTVQNGYQRHVLLVQAWDACGNVKSDCIELYLLDINPTDAIVILPKNHEVFCQSSTQGGGITVTAATLLGDSKKKLVFYYQAEGASSWIPFDSTESSSSVVWYPHALGLADGAYQLTVVAEDDAGNRSALDGKYFTTVHLSCTPVEPPVVIYPTANMFVGCPIEVKATATAPDAYNYITRVDFYYQPVTSSSATLIGTDYYSVDGVYSVAWAPSLNGDYYIWAKVTVKSGVTANSEKVWVRADHTSPEVYVAQVGDDHSDGGSGDPTVVTAGDNVDVFVNAFDRLQADGYGPEDNCGLDSVKIYVKYGSTVIFGALTHPTGAVNEFTATWLTAGLANGDYLVYAVATDSCCNNQTSGSWYVRIVNPAPAVAIAVEEALQFCESWRTNADSITVTVAPDLNATIDSVQVWYNSTSQSDVYDQYAKLGSTHTVGDEGYFEVKGQISGWAEGTYRLRAVAWVGGKATDDGNDSDTKFDDFTFSTAKAWCMELVVDRLAPTPVFTLTNSVVTAGTAFAGTISAPTCGTCDIDHYEYGIVTGGGVYGTRPEYTSSSCTFAFDPVDSGLVTLHNCYWGGYIRVTAYDKLGNSATYDMWVDILDVPDKYALVTAPAHGEYVEGTVTVSGVGVGAVDSVRFYYSQTTTGTKTRIAGASATTGTWNTSGLADGQYFLWATGVSGTTESAHHGAACAVPVMVANECAHVHLAKPIPSGSCHGGNVTFIGQRVDLMVDTLTSNIAIDSVVFKYKTLDAPGAPSSNGDPAYGWVDIAIDRYKATSWDVSWNLADSGRIVPDGYYVIMAFSYDRSGRECHSNSVTVFVDNTLPYSTITEINGDQTPTPCADVTSGEQVKIVAVAADDRSPLGSSDAYNSCPRYLQFFAGNCGQAAQGSVDIVWVFDASGSMGDDQAVVGGQIQRFVNSLRGLNYRLAVTAFESEGYFPNSDSTKSVPMNVDGSYGTPLAGTGHWTVVESTFNRMVTSVGVGGGTEDGVGALMETLRHYTFRSDAKKYFILVTDESGNDNELEAQAIYEMQQNGVTVMAVTSPGFATYSNIAVQTGGQVYDINSSDWGALLAVMGTQISGGGENPTPLGGVWSKTVDLSVQEPVAYWNTTGLAPGEYCLWTVVTDNVGNQYTSGIVKACVYDKTPPVAWIAGFGDATLACPTCQTHRIYAMTCDIDVKAMKFEMRQGTGEWTTIGVSSKIDSALWSTDWNPCGLADGNYELRAVPASDHYAIGTTEHITYDIDASVQPILPFTIAAGCVMTYTGGDVNAITFEDKTSGNLGITKVTTASAIAKLGMLGIYQPLGENTLTTEKVSLIHTLGSTEHVYFGNIDDQDILQGGTGAFYASYYSGTTSYLKMADVSVSRVYPQLGMPGTLTNVTTGASLMIERDAVSSVNGVIILPALVPTMLPNQNDLYKVWPNTSGMLPAIRFTTPLEGTLNTGKYAKIKIPYSASAPVPDSLALAWWDGDHWSVNHGIFFGGDAAGFNATTHTVEFWSDNLYGIYAVVSDAGVGPSGAITVQHRSIEPTAGTYTNGMPVIWTLVRSNITGNNNNWDIDEDQIHVKLDSLTIYNNGHDADGYLTTWDHVSGMLKTEWYGSQGEYGDEAIAPALTAGSHTYWVQAKNKQGGVKAATVTFTVDNTPPTIDFPHNYVCRNPEFKIVIKDLEAGVDLDSIQADVYDYDLSQGTALPADKLIYEEHASGFTKNRDTLIFSMTLHDANYRRLLVVLWDGTDYGRVWGQDDDDGKGGVNTYSWIYSNFHGVGDLVGNKATPVMRMFTVRGGNCSGGGGVSSEEVNNEPNPFDPWAGEVTTINIGNLDGGTVSVKLYDLTGEKVLTLAEQMPVINVGQGIVWDGKTVDGKYVASGVYLCHISGENGGRSFSKVLKIAVVKKD